jgi:hypothetical protein
MLATLEDQNSGVRFDLKFMGFGLLGRGIGFYAPQAVMMLLRHLVASRESDERFVAALEQTAISVGRAFLSGRLNVNSQTAIAAEAASAGIEHWLVDSSSDVAGKSGVTDSHLLEVPDEQQRIEVSSSSDDEAAIEYPSVWAVLDTQLRDELAACDLSPSSIEVRVRFTEPMMGMSRAAWQAARVLALDLYEAAPELHSPDAATLGLLIRCIQDGYLAARLTGAHGALAFGDPANLAVHRSEPLRPTDGDDVLVDTLSGYETTGLLSSIGGNVLGWAVARREELEALSNEEGLDPATPWFLASAIETGFALGLLEGTIHDGKAK